MNIHQHPTNNSVLAAPHGASIEQCRALPVTRLQYPDGQAVRSYWHPTDAERQAIANGHPIAVEVWGTTHPPMYVGVGHPQMLDLLRDSGGWAA